MLLYKSVYFIIVLKYRIKRGRYCSDMNVISLATSNTPFVANIGFENLMWSKPTFSTLFHLSFGSLLNNENRARSGTIQTVDSPLEVKVY